MELSLEGANVELVHHSMSYIAECAYITAFPNPPLKVGYYIPRLSLSGFIAEWVYLVSRPFEMVATMHP